MNVEQYQKRLELLVARAVYEDLKKYCNVIYNLSDYSAIIGILKLLKEELVGTEVEIVIEELIEKKATKKEILETLIRCRNKSYITYIQIYNRI